MKVAYCPFDDDDTEDLIAYNISRFHSGIFLEKFDKTICRYTGVHTQALSKVNSSQQVYVFGHGTPRSGSIDDCSGNSIAITELARRLMADGLKKSHKKIKLHSCSGGVGQAQSMAAQLRDAMYDLGYKKLIVYGYTENLSRTTTGEYGYEGGVSGARTKNAWVKFDQL